MSLEARVLEALPPQGFLREYVLYGMKRTEACALFHVAGGLSILTQTAPDDLHAYLGRKLPANLYSICVGPSSDGKSSTTDIANDTLRLALPGRAGQAPASSGALLEGMLVKPKQLITYSEFGNFLAESSQSYMASIRTTLGELYDCAPVSRVVVKNAKTPKEIQNPRLSLLGAVAPEYLEEYTRSIDWMAGFMARFLIFQGTRERSYDDTPAPPTAEIERMVNWIQLLAKEPTCPPFIDIEAKTKKTIWLDWMSKIRKMPAPDAVTGCIKRTPALALKIATLLAWDYGAARCSKEPWYITEAELVPALRLVQFHIESVIDIGENLATSEDMLHRRRILRLIERSKKPLSFGTICKESHLLQRRVRDVVETLKIEETIKMIMLNDRESLYVPDTEADPLRGAAPSGNVLQFPSTGGARVNASKSSSESMDRSSPSATVIAVEDFLP